MNFRKRFTIIIILCSLNTAGLAEGEALSLSPEQLIQRALEQNRDLQIAALEIDRAKSRSKWSGRLDNPELEVSGVNDFAGLDEGEAVLELAFVQKFPLTSRLKDEKNMRAIQVLLAQSELAENRRFLAYEVDDLAVKLLAAKNTRAAQERLIELNEEIADFLQNREKVGEASKLDVTQMRLNGRLLARRAAALDAEMVKLKLALKKRINIEPDQSLEVIGELTLPSEIPLTKIKLETVLRNRPDYLTALVKLDVAQADLKLQKSKRWEDIGMSFFAINEKSVDEPIGLERNTFLGIGFSIPLPLRKRNQQGIEVATINIEASDREGESRKFLIQNEIASALQMRSAAWKLAREAIGQDVRLANENFKAFETAYKNGQVSLIQVQRAQEQLIELETTALDLQREYHLADTVVRFVRAAYPGLGIPSSQK